MKHNTTHIHQLQHVRGTIIGVVCAISAILSSCSTDIVYTDSRTIKDAHWTMSDTVRFNAPLKAGTYNIDILVRSTEEYKYQNIWLFIVTTMGDSIVSTDTIQGFLSDNYGRRLGQGIGSKLTDYVQLTDSIAATDTTYTYHIRHGMRTDTLPGISDIGITIKHNTK